MTVGRVRKRDGRTVPFEREKIRDAVLGAQNAVGQHDPRFAQEVAELVTLELERRHARGGVPHIEEIQDLVERALIELGAAPVAKAYILYRDRHARMRAAVRVDEAPREGDPAGGGGPGGAEGAAGADARAPRVRHAGGVAEWGKGRIVAALMDEADLARPLAEDVAARVERRVFDSGLKRISTGLIRELCDNELVDLGLAGALRRHEAIGVPRHDLRRLLSAPPPAPVEADERGGSARVDEPVAEGRGGGRAVEARIGGAVLRRFVLEDVLEEHLVDRHQSGDLSIEDLDRPHLWLCQAVPTELLLRGATDARSPFDVLSEVARACAAVSRGVVLEGPAGALSGLARSGRGEGLASWLLALGAVARAGGVNVDLSGVGARHGALVARLVETLAALESEAPGDPLPRLFLELDEVEAALAADAGGDRGAADAVERLLRSGRIVPCWSRAGERVAGPGCHRRAREKGALACGGAVALNLARAARRAGPWREDRVLEILAELVRAALDVLEPLARFQREHRGARSGEVRGRVAYALTPVGLREALRHLGDGELRPSQGARLLGVLGEVARRYAAERRLPVVVTPFFGAAAAARFAGLDAGLPHVRQGRLFADRGAAADGAPDAPYSHGFRLSPVPGLAAGAAEAVLLSTVAGGALTELVRATSAERGGRAAARRQWLPPEPGAGGELLAAWRGFEAGRAAAQAGAAGVAAPEPEAARVLAPALFDDAGAAQDAGDGPPGADA